MEYHDTIHTVDKFWFKDLLHFFHYMGLHTLMIFLCTSFCNKTKILRCHDSLCSGIGSHNDNSIFEVCLSSIRIGNLSIIKYLK